MRIEFTNGTAIWEYSDSRIQIDSKIMKFIRDLKAGDMIDDKEVLFVIGDTYLSTLGGTYEPLYETSGGHPRTGVIYKGLPKTIMDKFYENRIH